MSKSLKLRYLFKSFVSHPRLANIQVGEPLKAREMLESGISNVSAKN